MVERHDATSKKPGSKERARVQRRSLAGGVAILVVAVATGCRDRASSKQGPGAVREEQVVAKPRIEVGVSGCSGLVSDPKRGLVCLTRKPKPLHLWLDKATDPKVELRFEGVVVEGKSTVDADGVLVSVELPKREGRLELQTDAGNWTMELVGVSDRFEALRKKVQASWRAGDGAAALKHLERAEGELVEHETALLLCSVAQVVLAAGDYERVLTIAEQVSSSSTVSCVGKASLLAAYVQIYLRPDFNAAERSLQTAEQVRGVDLDTRIGAAYLRGVLEHWVGEIDESLVAFERTARLAWLVGDHDQYASAVVMQAITLARLGRFSEAEALAAEVQELALVVYPTVALDIRSTVVWIAVLRREDDLSLPDPSPVLHEMISEYSAHGDGLNIMNRRLELALTLVQNSDIDAAASELAAIDPSVLDPNLLVWFELASARIDMLRRNFGAAAGHLDRAGLLAELSQDRELDWRVAVARGELERARGRVDAALEEFADASRLADELAMTVAGDAGRGRFVTSHSRADVALVELLLDKGDVKAAMCTAMAARARHLRGLWARLRPPLSDEAERHYRDLLSEYRERKQALTAQLGSSWSLSTTELSALHERLTAEGERVDQLLADATALLEQGAPTWSCQRALATQPGEAVLTMAPGSNHSQWTALLAFRNLDGTLMFDTAQVELNDAGLEAAADKILDRFSVKLEAAESLRVIPVGAFVSVEFHRLWMARGHETPVITYSLGLGEMTDSRVRDEQTAAVVAGSTDLAEVAREARAVADRLQEHGWEVEGQWNPDGIGQPTLLHYAGHGVDAGELGWDSALELPALGKVSARQIVAGQRSPDVVVLEACRAGRVTSESIDGGMNLAAAFLLAGAQLVIAPTRDVDDHTAYELGLGLYRDFETADAKALVRELSWLQHDQLFWGPATTESKSFCTWRAWTP